MRRRDFIAALGGAAVVGPRGAWGQQGERLRSVGILLPAAADNPEYTAWFRAFMQALGQLGWTVGSNLRIDVRWATANASEIRRHATELAARGPDVVLAHGAGSIAALEQATRTVPIVFAVLGDPVAAGFVQSLARPGGNITGFMNFELTIIQLGVFDKGFFRQLGAASR